MRKIGRLVRVRRLRAAMCDVAERAAPGAQVTQYHERCRAFAEALSDIRTRRLFANGMQVVFAQDVFDVLEALRVADAYPYPVGLFQALGWNNFYRRSAESASRLGGALLFVDGISHEKVIEFAAFAHMLHQLVAEHVCGRINAEVTRLRHLQAGIAAWIDSVEWSQIHVDIE